MRATVTVQDAIFKEADRAARKLKISRSRFYQWALEQHLRRLREQELTAQVNEHLEKFGDPESASLRKHVAKVWASVVGDDEW